MLRTRWQKVLIDLWRNRARTLVVALAIAVGVYAVGAVINTREILVREYEGGLAGALSAAAIIQTAPFDDDLAARIAEIAGVSAAEGRSVVRTRVYDEVDGTPRDLGLVSVPNFHNMQVDALTPLEGKWPPEKREVVLERQALEWLGAGIGDTITVELENDADKTLTVVGTVYDAQKVSPRITNRTWGYVTPETMDGLGLGELYTELHIRVAHGDDDQAHIQAVVDEIDAHLERTGRQIYSKAIITETLAEPFIDTVVLILTSLGLIILLLSGFLVINAITALITQQIPQIGVMKLVGARRVQIMSLYIVTVLVYGLIAIVIGIPLSILTSRFLMTGIVEGLLNVMPNSYAVPLPLLAVQAAVGLLLPLLAGLAPVIKGTGITTQKALNDVGMGSGAQREGLLERLLQAAQRIKGIQRPIVLAVRNTLRHKGRLAQTLIVLIVGTALFISVLSVQASVDATLDDFMRFHQYDVSVSMEQPYRTVRLESAAQQVPGVVDVEGWSEGLSTRLRPDGTESDGIRVVAVPADTTLMAPEISEGRWLTPGTGNGIVVNSDVLDDEPDLQVGQEIVLDIGGREQTWLIVGTVPTESRGPAIYMADDDYAYATRTPGQATDVKVIAQRHDAAGQQEIEAALFDHFESLGLEVRGTETTAVIQTMNELLFTIVVAFLILMALLLAGVGGLGLTTTMSINILERVREIGVLRAIGASNLSVRRIVLAEGIVIGVLSWLVGVLLSIPISAFMSKQLGLALIQVPLTHHYSIVAAIGWFFGLLAVAIIASLGPARNAVRLTVREVLAYE